MIHNLLCVALFKGFVFYNFVQGEKIFLDCLRRAIETLWLTKIEKWMDSVSLLHSNIFFIIIFSFLSSYWILEYFDAYSTCKSIETPLIFFIFCQENGYYTCRCNDFLKSIQTYMEMYYKRVCTANEMESQYLLFCFLVISLIVLQASWRTIQSSYWDIGCFFLLFVCLFLASVLT